MLALGQVPTGKYVLWPCLLIFWKFVQQYSRRLAIKLKFMLSSEEKEEAMRNLPELTEAMK